MEQVKTDTRTGLQYELQDNYYLIAGEGEEEMSAIGIWGRRHLRWPQQNRRVTYTNLLTTGRLCDYLFDIDQQANEQLDALILQIAEIEGVTEQLKADNQLRWVQSMNSIRNRAEEIVLSELGYC